jgi:hypothetical protein
MPRTLDTLFKIFNLFLVFGSTSTSTNLSDLSYENRLFKLDKYYLSRKASIKFLPQKNRIGLRRYYKMEDCF